ncbi:MAG: type VI secretion system accessory protein TagJ [Terriglobales bacterium]
MTAIELFRAGKLTDAVKTLTEEVRNHPTDVQKRTFLFELLCFAGEMERAEKQLDVLAQSGKQSELGALLYRAALHAERERRQFFTDKAYLEAGQHAVSQELTGSFNGKPFRQISDADPRIGARLEVYVAGRYLWVPFEHIASVEMQAPKRLRDLLWMPALVKNGPSFQGRDLGEVLVPVLSPFSSTQEDEVRLGRATVWEDVDGAEVPFGQKMLLIDGEEVPLLELRMLEFAAAAESAATG